MNFSAQRISSPASTLGVHTGGTKILISSQSLQKTCQVRHLRKMRKVVLKHLKLEAIEEEISISLSPLALQALGYYKKGEKHKDLLCSPQITS